MGSNEINRDEDHLARHIRAFGELLISFADGLSSQRDGHEDAFGEPSDHAIQVSGKRPMSSRPVKEDRYPALTIQQMILEALTDAQARGKPGMMPSAIRQYIAAHYGLNSTSVNATAWRMWHDLQLISKDDETGLYSLTD